MHKRFPARQTLFALLALSIAACTGAIDGQTSPTSTDQAAANTLEYNQRIVFVSNRNGGDTDIFVMNADGSGLQALTDNDEEEGFLGLAASPDGTQIAFTVGYVENPDLYVMNSDGSDRRALADSPNWETNPVWSPDSTRIAFAQQTGSFVLNIINADGSGQQALTQARLTANRPVWSAEGTRVFIGGNGYATEGALAGIYEVTVETGEVKQRTEPNAVINPDNLSISPDGTRIAFMDVADPNGAANFDLFLFDTLSGSVTPLANTPANERYPVWSPDGSRIVFRLGAGGESTDQLALVEVSTGEITPLTTSTEGHGQAISPQWSADGQWLVFAAVYGGSNTEILRINADGTGLTRLTDSESSDYSPVLLPPISPR
ncbi:MAG: hypothetical protein U0670_06725 [Anaerolineae bacterium]